jgi:glycogen operon protein
MTDTTWSAGYARCLGMYLVAHAMEELDEEGERIRGDSFLVLFNAGVKTIPFALPEPLRGHGWTRILDTWFVEQSDAPVRRGARYALRERSLAVLRMEKQKE